MDTSPDAKQRALSAHRYLFQMRLLPTCVALGVVLLSSMESNAAPRSAATPTAIPVRTMTPTSAKAQQVCCHIGLFRRDEAKTSIYKEPSARVTAQGDYFMLPVDPGTQPQHLQDICKLNRDTLFEWFNRRAEEIDLQDGITSEFNIFKLQRRDGWNPGQINTPITEVVKITVPDGKGGSVEIYRGEYDRTEYYTVSTAEPRMCQKTWCGVEGVLSDEKAGPVPAPTGHRIMQRDSAAYRYHHYLGEKLDDPKYGTVAEWTKETFFEMPIMRIAAGGQCNCEAMKKVPPPWHGADMDEVFPTRDWWIPSNTAEEDRLSTDLKYSKGLCAAP